MLDTESLGVGGTSQHIQSQETLSGGGTCAGTAQNPDVGCYKFLEGRLSARATSGMDSYLPLSFLLRADDQGPSAMGLVAMGTGTTHSWVAMTGC